MSNIFHSEDSNSQLTTTDISNELNFNIYNTKPNITYLLSKFFTENKEDNAMLTCGPSKMTDEVNEVCKDFNIDISNEIF
jgi:NAD(P)H-flavin reductase